MSKLRFGCSGWDYQEWVGPFYRAATPSKLAAYARVFDTAEINSTFYRAPVPGMVRGWVRYSPDGFVFAAKVPRTVTHWPPAARPEAGETLVMVGMATDRS